MTQKSITIVSVTGHSDYTLGSQYAIERSYLELRNHITHLECLLISPDKPDNLPSYIRHICCEPFSYVEYNLFMLYALHQFIHTDFALTVQDDGWILDGNLWRDEFLDYDYIGAPIPCYIYAEHTGSYTILERNYWAEHFSPIPPHCIEPQNGGVSLRSKRILTAPRDYHITASLSMAGASETEPIKLLNPEHGANNEDIILSGYHRPMLEAKGFRFAPRDIALQFAMEDTLFFNTYNQKISKQIPLEQIMASHYSGYVRLISNRCIESRKFNFPDSKSVDDNVLLKRLGLLGYDIVIPADLNFTNVELHLKYNRKRELP